MQNQSIDYFDGQTLLKGILIYPDTQNKEKYPAIIVFPAFDGIGEFAIDYGQKLAQNGYVVLVADMYGNAKNADTIDGCFQLVTPFLDDRELLRRRAVLAYETLAKHSNVDYNNIGAIGFCFGGTCVLEIARSGVNLKAGVGIHSGFAKSALPTYPIKGSLLIIHGYKDPQVPHNLFADFANELEQAHTKDWTFTFLGDAKHSFTNPKAGTIDPNREISMGREYNARAANRSYRYAVEFFNELLLD